MHRMCFLCLVSSLIMFCCGFDGCNSKPPITQFTMDAFDAPVPKKPLPPGTKPPGAIARPFTLVYGSFELGSETPDTQGTAGGYDGFTDFKGQFPADNVKVPGRWDHYVNFGPTPQYLVGAEPCVDPEIPEGPGIEQVSPSLWRSLGVPMTNGEELAWYCYISDPLPGGSTSFAIQGSLPSTLTLYSNGVPLSTANGYPQVYIYGMDTSGNSLFNAITAISVAPDGSNATFPFPSQSDGTSLLPSLYGLALVNTNTDGSMSPAGPHFLSVGSTQQFNTPFGVGAQVEQTSWYESDTQDPYGDGTCAGQNSFYSGTNTYTYPVVTQYSQGNVNVGGTLVGVGANPTAIALYHSMDSSTYNQYSPCSYGGTDDVLMGNAVVTNSGGNTVSILDLVSRYVIATVTVGQNPSALVLSADQTVAYVANSGDGTLSSVNLNSFTQTSNVYVGSLPQTVEMAPDGSIWVGGNGFLAHLNPSMQVLGTYSTNGFTISSLKYNYAAGELVASSVDSSGGLFVQEIDDAATSSNGAVMLNAQRRVSTLTNDGSGPYYSSTARTSPVRTQMATGTHVGAFGSDSWLTLSGTASGFTVTNSLDHVGFVDGWAPSPVTSVAIDPSEYVAYMALPDSNQVITVYLPY